MIQVSFVNAKTNLESGKPFTAEFHKYFSVNRNLSNAYELVKKGVAWEGAESFGNYLRIEKILA